MPLLHLIVVIRQIIHSFMDRWSSTEHRQLLTKICFFLLLSCFTTIVTNVLFPVLVLKTSPLSISSSPFSLLAPNHIFFSSEVAYLQYSSQQHHDLQTQFNEQDLLEKTLKYTKDHPEQKNISFGKMICVDYRKETGSILTKQESV